MRALRRTTLSVALTLAPIMGAGCVSMSPKVTYSRTMQQRDQKMNTARLEESRGNFDLCKTLYEEIYLQNPSYIDCIHRLAVVSTRLNRHNEAEAYFQQVNTLKPNDPEILADMGFAAFMRKDYEQAESLLEQSLRLRGNEQRIIVNLAIVQAWRRKDEASLANFRKVKGEPDALRSLAAIQIARGDQEQATRLYDLASAAGSTSPAVNQGISQTSAVDLPSPESDLPPSPEPLQPKAKAIPTSRATQTSQQSAPTSPPPSKQLRLKEALFAEPAQLAEDPVPPSPVSTAPVTTAPPIAPPICSPQSCTRVAPLEQTYPLPVPPASAPLPPDETSTPEKPRAPAAPEPYEASGQRPSEVTIAADLQPAKHSEPEPEPVPVRIDEQPKVAAATPPEPQQVQTVAAQPESSFRMPSVWRKTPASRGGPPEESDVSFAPVIMKQTSPTVHRSDDKTSVWSICLVTLLEEKRLAPARPEFSMEYLSHEYRFSTAEALEKFRAAPHLYAPVAGGLDIVAVRNERSVVEGSLNFSLWYRRQLYLFSSREHAEAFRREPNKYASLN